MVLASTDSSSITDIASCFSGSNIVSSALMGSIFAVLREFSRLLRVNCDLPSPQHLHKIE